LGLPRLGADMTDIAQSDVAEALRLAIKRAFPPAVMAMEDIAEVFGYSYSHVHQKIVCLPDFPAPLPKFKQPRWAWSDIQRWMNDHPV